MSPPAETTRVAQLRRRLRARRFQRVEALIREILETRDRARILDVGGRADYWAPLAEDLRGRVHVTLLNTDDEHALFRADDLGIEFEEVQGDGCAMPQYADGAFDLTHSNSVLEHVGSYERMIAFADETRRVGRACYVQTPYLWFPIEPHYLVPVLHWLPDALRIRLHSSMRLGRARRVSYKEAMIRADIVRMVDKPLMRALFPDAELSRERWMLMTKSLIAARAPAPEGASAAAPEGAPEAAPQDA